MRYPPPGTETPLSPRAILLAELLAHGPLLRAQLARLTGYSLASLTRLAQPMIDTRLVRELDDAVRSPMGRPAYPLDVNTDSRSILGVKIKETEVIAVRTNLRARSAQEVKVPFTTTDPDSVSRAVARAVAKVAAGPVTGVGVAVGGSVSNDGVVLWAPHLGWRDVPLATMLRELLTKEGVVSVNSDLAPPVAIENDVVALTLGELWFGAAREVSDFAVVTVGVGLGFGRVAHHRVVTTPDDGLGLHLILASGGAPCALGHERCAAGILTVDDSEQAATALGELIGAAAELAGTSLVLVAGEKSSMLDRYSDTVARHAAAGRHPDARAVEIRRLDGGFERWAQGAAAVVIVRALESLANSA